MNFSSSPETHVLLVQTRVVCRILRPRASYVHSTLRCDALDADKPVFGVPRQNLPPVVGHVFIGVMAEALRRPCHEDVAADGRLDQRGHTYQVPDQGSRVAHGKFPAQVFASAICALPVHGHGIC